ncbi:DJ-1/PfpI family protein [Alkalibacter rhizosphaerae]|uniref:DJ-1/PfpI family protein n=1 Tax=Alkalibacter rhizosphaerae TaxID=2815577 RepID=A0A975AI24_9FIRM|nr:DJ-1 family glyoxalase III [Alkalibacter rhizosphaerae]QSX08633.1 DJ-1/PfpI family protein [Alkalibacter rhizosphaerae]
MRVAVFLANGFEEIEALATVDVLRRAGFDTKTVSMEEDHIVEGAHGISVVADDRFSERSFVNTDLLVLPGGMPGTLNLGNHSGLIQLLMDHDSRGKWIAAICAAPKILGELGLLKGQFATCYPGFEQYLEGAVLVDEKVAVSSHFVTGKGAGAAVDFALKLVELFIDLETSESLRKSLIAD